jgi:hypothetical protein
VPFVFLVIGEPNGLGKGRLQVFLKELAEPALAEHEMHVDTLLTSATTTLAEVLATAMRRGKRSLALAADLSRVSLPNRGCPLAAHGGI